MFNRAAHCRRRLRAAIVGGLAVAALSTAPPGLAQEPAADEYSVEIPGVKNSDAPGNPQRLRPASQSGSETQPGVAGETSSASPLDALAASLADNILIVIGAPLLLIAVALAARTAPLRPQ